MTCGSSSDDFSSSPFSAAPTAVGYNTRCVWRFGALMGKVLPPVVGTATNFWSSRRWEERGWMEDNGMIALGWVRKLYITRLVVQAYSALLCHKACCSFCLSLLTRNTFPRK